MDDCDLIHVPGWLLEKKYGDYAGVVVLAIQVGHAAIKAETEKAVLVEWQNTELSFGPCGGEFWVAKSLL